jgi:type II secretion system protein I
MSVASRPGRMRRIRGARSKTPPAGFSLLEVILAVAILAAGLAVLGEITRSGLENTRVARELTQAQLLCESKMAEVLAGLAPPEPENDVPFDPELDLADPDWVYSTEVNTLDEEGLLEIRVTVTKEASGARQPVRVALVCWMIDPEVEAQEETGETGQTEADLESLF